MLSTAATLIAVGGLALAGAGSASAHSAMVTGTAQCRPDGTESVAWTVTNDYPLSVQVTQASSTGGGSVTGLPVTIAAAASSATTNASVHQVGIAPGTATATLAVHGVWSDGFTADSQGMVTLPRTCAPTATAVTPVAPVVATSHACNVPGSVTIATTTGVAYFLDGAPIAPGEHPGPLSGTVTATAGQGYLVTGTSSWPVSVPAADACPHEVTPVAPTLAESEPCAAEGFLTVPATPGVDYFFNGAQMAAGTHVGPLSGTVTAKAVDGFELTGTASWAVQIDAAGTCQTGSGETSGETSGSETSGTPVVTATPTAASPSPAALRTAASPSPAALRTAALTTATPVELAYTGISPQALTFGVGGGFALLLLGGVLTLSAAVLRR